MINFKINLDSGLITLEKPSGKSLSLQAGETVKADVLDVLASGDVTLRIKGMIVTAKAEVQLQKDSTAYFKVTNMPNSETSLKLQFVGYSEPGATGTPAPGFAGTPQGEVISKLIDELSANLLKDPGNINPKTIESLLKSLPSDMSALPKDMRSQLQELLQSSLKSAGQSIQSRLNNFFNLQLPEEIKNQPLVKNITQDLMVSVEKLLQAPLKNILQDTGVALEAKLRTIAELLQQVGEEGTGTQKPLTLTPQQLVDYTNILKSIDAGKGLVPLTVTKDGALAKPVEDLQTTTLSGPEKGLNSVIASQTKELLSTEILQQNINNNTGASKAATETENVPQQPVQDGSVIKNAEPDKGVAQLPSGKEIPKAPEKDSLQTQAKPHMTADDAVFNKDLKAGLLQLKQILTEEGRETLKNQPMHTLTPDQKETAIRSVDGLLKDIETFQLLSKTTDSFYTFLPVTWNELKDGEVAFKKGSSSGNAGGGESYSCRINLDLEKYGKLTITVLKYNKEFFVSFRAENTDFQSSLKAHADELQDSFKEKGMFLKAVSLLDTDDNSFEQLENLGSADSIISIKA